MLNLPEVTQLQKPLPKSQIYKKFQFTNAQQIKFDADISRIDIVNEVRRNMKRKKDVCRYWAVRERPNGTGKSRFVTRMRRWKCG